MNPVELLNATVQGSGPHTVVFGNGFATTQASWDQIVAQVPDDWRIVRFDYVGTTPATTGAWIPERYAAYDGHADDIARLLSALEIENAVFVAHSMSGMVAALASTLAPTRIGHLVTIGASPCYGQTGDYDGGFTSDDIHATLRAADADLAAWMSGFGKSALGSDATPEHFRAYLGTLLAMRPDIGRTMLHSIFASDYRELLPALSVPVTVIQTAHDFAVPVGVAFFLAQQTFCSGIHVLDASGHLPHITHPALLMPVLERVLTEHKTALHLRPTHPLRAAPFTSPQSQ